MKRFFLAALAAAAMLCPALAEAAPQVSLPFLLLAHSPSRLAAICRRWGIWRFRLTQHRHHRYQSADPQQQREPDSLTIFII